MAPTEHRGPRSKCPSVGKLHASGREKATQPCRPALWRLDEDDEDDDGEFDDAEDPGPYRCKVEGWSLYLQFHDVVPTTLTLKVGKIMVWPKTP